MSESKPWGPDNPHPLSTRKTELIWEGKYDEYGNRRPVSLPAFPLVMQRIETIDAPRDRAKAQGALWEEESAHRDDFRNRLIWGDNKLALAALLQEFRGKVDLIYIDPPFFTGTDQRITIKLGEGDIALLKETSIIEEVAYRNIWGLGPSSFCHWISEFLTLMKQLLTQRGLIFIRFDQYWSHTVKLVADEIFGKEQFQNEIIVNRIHKNVTEQGKLSMPLATDTLLLYQMSKDTRYFDIYRALKDVREGYWRRMDDSSGVRNPPVV